MPRDRKRLGKVIEHEKKGKEGKKEKVRSRSQGPEESEEMESEATGIEVLKLDEVISTRQTDSQKTPQKPERDRPITLSSKFSTIEYEISSRKVSQKSRVVPVRPRGETNEFESFSFSINGIKTCRSYERNLTTRRPAKQVNKKESSVMSVRKLETSRRETALMERMELKDRVSSREEEEIEFEEKDPFFSWPIGSPYSSRSPKLILVVDREGIPVVEMLKVLLRDTYREIEGGEPGAYPVEFIANEPRFPEIQGNIVTLDLNGGAWNATLENERPSIKKGGQDIVPKLREISQNLFTGKLGFLIVSLSPKWEDSWRLGKDFIENLESHLAASQGEDQLPPVLRASHIGEEESFRKKACCYFGIKESSISDDTGISQMEEIRNVGLRRNNWRRISITKKSKGIEGETSQESDEHYFMKASLTEGFAYECFKHRKRDEPGLSFDDFFQKYVLGEDWIKTEPEKDLEVENIRPDGYISLEGPPSEIENAIRRAMKTFCEPELEENQEKMYFEVETGRSEGAFNFRKFRNKTNDYYEENRLSDLWIVIPPRLLFRGKKRAEMILNIVKKGSEDKEANLAFPILNKWGCSGLRVITENYIKKEIYGAGSE